MRDGVSIREVTTTSGLVSHQVRWREGGKRDGKACSATFDTAKKASVFKGLVMAAGKHYPKGWVPGKGWSHEADKSTKPTLGEWFAQSIQARTRANDRTKKDYLRDFDRYVPQELAETPVDEITKLMARQFVTDLQKAKVTSLSGRKKRGEDRCLSPKSVHNIHGAVSSAMNDAQADGLITLNPFKGLLETVPIRQEDMVFLTKAEFERFIKYVSPKFADFVTFLFGTGLRWGEATALMVETVDLDAEGGPTLTVVQSWKREDETKGRWYIGDPKTPRARRTISLSPAQAEMLRPRVEGKPKGTLVWQNTRGRRIQPSTFYNNIWVDALRRAAEDGFPKTPRVHDMRHSHISLLLNAGRPLLEVSRRAGHENTKTTSDRYGHSEGDRGSAQALTDLGF